MPAPPSTAHPDAMSSTPSRESGAAGRTAAAMFLALLVIVGLLLSIRYGAVVTPLLDAFR